MLTTKKKVRKQIDDLQLDLEIINPIESKKILGGYWYDNSNNGGWYDNGDGITIISNGSGGLGYNDWGTSSWGLNDSGPDYSSEWDYGSGQDQGGGSSDETIDETIADGILENPNATELWWLFTNTNEVTLGQMAHNRDVALEYGRTREGELNGEGDALRHAMWSAMDAADLGLAKAREFHTLHETSNPDRSNAMDLHNNNWGFQWFQQHGNPDGQEYQFVVDFLTAVNNGQIQTHP